MAEDRTDPLADLFTLFATPLTGTVRSFEQFRKGVDEFLAGVENFNRTMANLNETSERINRLLADVEGPIRAAVPQVTRTVKAADEMMQVVSGPAIAVAPGLHRLAETLNTPAFAQLPQQIGQFSELLGEVSHRLAPLAQFAGSAGGLLGGFRVPGMRAAGGDAPSETASKTPSAGPSEQSTETSPATKSPETKSAKTTSSTTKSSARKAPAKKSVRTSSKKVPAKRVPAKKPAQKPAKKASSRNTSE
jgi:ABC-type transporter Mla subunit MlaD